jgi:uncharacterized phage-associated protein
MYDARQIANWFVRRSAADGKKLSIMQLLKLVYISHGWHLEITGNPLFRNKIEAWQHGPVVPDVYREFRPKGVIVDHIDGSMPEGLPARLTGFLDEIYRLYGSYSPFRLSEITHVPGGPWDQATKRHGWYAPITDDVILDHYRKLRSERREGSSVN